ncbi:aminoglycoside phosphotransferase family protein [Rhodanobacter denitrificans]|uniref:phosphotransferase family protein n=1 Tax=Rhodanobacter denitrificans TaxID=666685 RepID=UPI0009DB5B42|nr:phosphotransferase [Rhodanobacter denitrificans]UJM91443.1 aminoglycoside phosphotransferase family protein [Rhodanobacter denitrificans]
MTGLGVAGLLNARFICTSCRASGSWIAVTRPLPRQNSSIQRLRCVRCQEQIVAKVSRRDDLRSDARAESRREYETLCTLQRVFPQDEHFGTLLSLGYLESAGRGIMVTRHFCGDNLAQHLRSLGEPDAREACRAAGVWLRKLHQSGDPDVQMQMLGVADKLDYLAVTYGAVLRRDRETWTAYRCLEQTGLRMDAREFAGVRQHGDFKPQNMLCDGTRYIGLDIHWQSIGPAVYDLAPFLNHLWLVCRTFGSLLTNRHYLQRESMFLAGYGYGNDPQAVYWAQLYFALCYLGAYRQKGRLAANYARWRIGPLVRELARRLEEVS